MDAAIGPASPDDLFVWPDGAWCYRSDSIEMAHRPDDYITLAANSEEWRAKVREETLPEDADE